MHIETARPKNEQALFTYPNANPAVSDTSLIFHWNPTKPEYLDLNEMMQVWWERYLRHPLEYGRVTSWNGQRVLVQSHLHMYYAFASSAEALKPDLHNLSIWFKQPETQYALKAIKLGLNVLYTSFSLSTTNSDRNTPHAKVLCLAKLITIWYTNTCVITTHISYIRLECLKTILWVWRFWEWRVRKPSAKLFIHVTVAAVRAKGSCCYAVLKLELSLMCCASRAISFLLRY